MSPLRALSLLLGVPMLVIGIFAVTVDVTTQIQDALNTDPHLRVITTFPLGTICGALMLWLGYRLLFTKPTRPFLPGRQRPPVSD